jgi:hypothetical protein
MKKESQDQVVLVTLESSLSQWETDRTLFTALGMKVHSIRTIKRRPSWKRSSTTE